MHMINDRVMTVSLPTLILPDSIALEPSGDQDNVVTGAIVVSLSNDFARGPLHLCQFEWRVKTERESEFHTLTRSDMVTQRNVMIIATHPRVGEGVEIGIESIDLVVDSDGDNFYVNVIS